MRVQINDVQTMYADRRVVLRYTILDDAGNVTSRPDAVMDMPFADGVTQADAEAYVTAHVQLVAPQVDAKVPDAVTDALLHLGNLNAAVAAKRAEADALDAHLAAKRTVLADTLPAAAPTKPMGVQ